MKSKFTFLKIWMIFLLVFFHSAWTMKAQAQDAARQTLQGNVVDTEGEPLLGVTVLVKGTTTGTVTNMDGAFSLQAPSDAETLVFSFVGMATQEVIIGNRTTFSVTMEYEAIGLQEIVTVGYGTQRKATVTGSVSNVNNTQIVDRPVRRLDQALTGKIAGVTITDRGGIPGSPAGQFQIRNFGNPLIIVDGMEQSFNFMDPEEIESITVLKDAAAAIYGLRAGNGVVLVTTKRGKVHKPQFKLSSSYTMSQPTTYPPFADAATYATLRNYALVHAGNQPMWTEEEIEKFRDGSDPNYPNTDWWSETFKPWAPMKDLNMSASGGTEAVKYFVSLGGRDEGSTLKSNAINFKRYNLRSNVDVMLTKRLMGSFDLSSRFENREQPGLSFELFDPGIMQALIRALPIYPARYPDETKVPYAGQKGYNPVFASQKDWSGYQRERFKSIRSSIKLNYDLGDFVQGLSTEAKFDYRMNDTFAKDWVTGYNTYDYTYDVDTDTYTYIPTAEKFNDGKTTLNERYVRDWDWFLNYKIDYQRLFNNTHRIGGMILYEARETRVDRFGAYREGFITRSIDQIFAGSDLNKDNSGTAGEGGSHSIVGRFNYGFRDKYLAEFLFRYDADGYFHPDYRWGFFPGVSLGYVISEEDFMKNAGWIDNLKLRLSTGKTGLTGDRQFNYLSGYEFAGTYIFDPTEEVLLGLRSTGIANPLALWATNTISNIGIDGSIWNEKLTIEANVFYRLREGILATRAQSIPGTFGAILPEENLNSESTRGWELEVGHNNKIGAVNYRLFGNLSWSRSKWEHFDEPAYTDPEEIYRYKQTGRWTNVSYGYLTDGLFESEEEIDNWADITNGADNANILPGDVKFLDLNADSLIDWRDQRIIGKGTLPTTNFAFGGNLGYKGFDFNILFTGATGFSKFYGGQMVVPFGLDFNCFEFFQDAWTIDNPNPNAPYPRLRLENQGGHPNTEYASDFWVVENAYYIRLKELQLSYNFPKKLLSPLKLNNLRLNVTGYNLALLSNIKVDDPENTAEHGRYYPQQRSISLGLNVNF